MFGEESETENIRFGILIIFIIAIINIIMETNLVKVVCVQLCPLIGEIKSNSEKIEGFLENIVKE